MLFLVDLKEDNGISYAFYIWCYLCLFGTGLLQDLCGSCPGLSCLSGTEKRQTHKTPKNQREGISDEEDYASGSSFVVERFSETCRVR
jgi:hypothetical protein